MNDKEINNKYFKILKDKNFVFGGRTLNKYDLSKNMKIFIIKQYEKLKQDLNG